MLRTQRLILHLALSFAILPAIARSVAVAQTDAVPEPLSKTKILRGLEVGVAQKLIATRVGEQGIDFAVTPEIEKELKNAGANEELIAAIRKAKVVSKVQPQMAALVITADADCTVDVNGTSFQMKAGEIKNVSAAVGDNIVQAVSKQDASVTWRQVVQVGSSEQKAVLIELPMPAHDPGTNTTMQDQRATVHEGASALDFVIHGNKWTYIATVERVDLNGEAGFKFPVTHNHQSLQATYLSIDQYCSGFLYVFPDRVIYDPVYTPQDRKDAFDSRAAGANYVVKRTKGILGIRVEFPYRRYNFIPLFRNGSTSYGYRGKKQEWEGAFGAFCDLLALAATDFHAAELKFQELARESSPQK